MSTSLPVNAPPRGKRTYFYLALPVLMLAIALIGFWPQYYGRLLSGSALDIGSGHVLVHAHSSLFLGWLAILFAQAWFVRADRVDLHRRFGPLFATYGYGAADRPDPCLHRVAVRNATSCHVVWFVGLAVFTARLLVEGLASLPPWLPIGRALIRPFT